VPKMHVDEGGMLFLQGELLIEGLRCANFAYFWLALSEKFKLADGLR
jgi:hypothetical protein